MTTVVVGHGRSPEGKGWGPKIDACSTVVRMWDWHWQHPSDYGKRYDYGLLVLTKRNLHLFLTYNSRQPAKGWLVYIGKPTKLRIPPNAQVIDTERWCSIGKSLGGMGLGGSLTLTRGSAAAAWAIEHAGWGEKVLLLGFDNVDCGINQPMEESFSPEYQKVFRKYWDEKKLEKIYPIGGAKTATHDMAIEKPLLERLAQSCNVNLKFVKDSWG